MAEVTDWQRETFLDWVNDLGTDYCCAECKPRPCLDDLCAIYSCPVCGDEWYIECPPGKLDYDPSDRLYDEWRARKDGVL